MPDGHGLLRAFHPVGHHAVGWCYSPADPSRRFAVEVRVDGETLALVLAETFVPTLREAHGGDGCYGFLVRLDPERVAGATLVEAYVANTGIRLGAFRLDERPDGLPGPSGRIAGDVIWRGGLRITGWACDLAAPMIPQSVEILVDGDTVAQVTPHRWREADLGEAVPSGRFAFDVGLPQHFADGQVHTVRCLVAGAELAGSPCEILVHALGFEGLASDIDPDGTTGNLLRARMLDRLMPASIPMAEFEAWRSQFPVSTPHPGDALVGVAVIGDVEGAVGSTLVSLGAQSHPHWLAVSIAAEDGTFSREAFATAASELVEAGVELVAFVEAGALLDAHALAHLAAAMEDSRYPGVVYSDSAVRSRDGRVTPSFKPAYDRHRMLAQGYAADLFAVSRHVIEGLRAAPPTSVWDLLFRSIREAEGLSEPVAHLPEVLVTVPQIASPARTDALARAAEIEAAAHGLPLAASAVPGAARPLVHLSWPDDAMVPRVSVIIPTRDRLDLLQPCIETLLRVTTGIAFEVIVVDNGSREPATLAFLEALAEAGGTVVRDDGPFNFARLNNRGVARARHDVVCLLNSDVEVIEPGWLREMALALTDPTVGVVGATLLWPSRIVQHGGVVLGPNFAVAHAFNDRMDGEAGYDDLLLVPRRHSAVTAACLVMRKADYLQAGGMDEDAFPVNFNDVDLCLKLSAAGRSVIVTPKARLIHRESASRGLDRAAQDTRARSRKEFAALRHRWGHLLASDPFYNPNLSLDPHPYSGLATPARSRQLRVGPDAGG
jgi:GT2 family glycosyltransferase